MRDDRIELCFDDSPLEADSVLRRHRIAAPDFGPIDVSEDVRRLACHAWEDRLCAEYVGVMVARRFHGLLVDVNAPIDLQELAVMMMSQEQRHASLCLEAARALGSSGNVAFDVSELQQARTTNDVELELLRMICGTYAVGEVAALSLLKDTLRGLPRSGFRRVLESIARDEVLHARIGPLLIRELLRAPGLPWLGQIGRAQVIDLVEGQRVAMRRRDVVAADEPSHATDPLRVEAARRLGLTPAAEFQAAYKRAVEVVVPRELLRVAGLSI